jgi:hypothetical protein
MDVHKRRQRLELTFTPRYDRQSDINALVVKSVQHQVFVSLTDKPSG